MHQLDKLVDGAPLRRPWWYFDARVQGSGPVDIPTHAVDQAQWLVDGDGAAAELVSARAWSTRVPVEAFCRITGEAGFPQELDPFVDGAALSYRCNAELVYRIGRVTASATTRWDLSAAARRWRHLPQRRARERAPRPPGAKRPHGPPPPGVRGAPADAEGVLRALRETVAAWQADARRRGVPSGPATFEVTVPPPLDGGHETHFAKVLDEFLNIVDARGWPEGLAARTLAKYTLLAEAAAKTGEP